MSEVTQAKDLTNVQIVTNDLVDPTIFDESYENSHRWEAIQVWTLR